MKTKGKLSKSSRVLLAAVGFLSLLAGIVGIFVPVWPTTCFLLLSTACFSRSSDRLYPVGDELMVWWSCPPIQGRLSLLLSIALVKSSVWLVVALVTIGIAVSLHLLKLPVQKPLASVR